MQCIKVMILLEEDELKEEDCLMYLSEFLVTGSISHLFSFDEQTAVVNSIRSSVTQASLGNTRKSVWTYFLEFVILLFFNFQFIRIIFSFFPVIFKILINDATLVIKLLLAKRLSLVTKTRIVPILG